MIEAPESPVPSEVCAPVSWRVLLGDRLASLPFIAVHLIAVLGLFVAHVRWTSIAATAVAYVVGMVFITIGYHRYFSHRSFRTSRAFQFVLAFGCMASAQKGVLWWAAHHRHHHRYSDQPEDIHSPKQGFFWSHVGWVLSSRFERTRYELVRDLAKFRELTWLNRYPLVPPVAVGVVAWLIGGWTGLYWAFLLPLVLLWHGSFTVNSLAHTWGRRRFKTTDTSRNNVVLALLTMGEGWHNNHHHYQASARQGFYWWEVDVSYYVLKACEWLGLVWDVITPPAKVLSMARE